MFPHVNTYTKLKRKSSIVKNVACHNINKAVAITSVVAGIVAWIGCYHSYLSCSNILPSPLLIGILCSALFSLLFVSVWVSSLVTGSFNKDSQHYKGIKSMMGYFLLGILAILLLATLLEFLYELTPKQKEIKATSYIFILDESGSMGTNDPSGLRYEAIPQIMKEEDPDFPYMIYTFSDTTRIAQGMGTLDSDYERLPVVSNGGTTIFGTITQVLDDYKNGVWDGGANPKIIFLTDGKATDLSNGFLWFKGNRSEFNDTLEEYKELGINISTVGLGSVDRDVMTKMAETTGGIFVPIQDATDLASAMKAAATSYSDRNLLSIRYMKQFDTLYGIFRILYLAVIGAVIGSLLLFAYMEDTSIPIIVFSSILLSLVGSILLEIGLKIGVPQSILWLMLWETYSLTLGFIYPKKKSLFLLTGIKDCTVATASYRMLSKK